MWEKGSGWKPSGWKPVGWVKKSTKRFDILADADSDDGAHFSFNRSKTELHATFDRGKTHIPIDTGLAAITQFETLKSYGDLERKTELRYLQTMDKTLQQTSVSIFPSERKRKKEPKPWEPILGLTKVKHYETTDELLQEALKNIREGKSNSGQTLNFPIHGQPASFEYPDRPLSLGMGKYPKRPTGMINDPVLNSVLSSKSNPTLPGSVPDSKGPYLAGKAQAEYWRDRSYAEEAIRIKNSMEGIVDIEKKLTESMRIEVGSKYKSTEASPELRLFSLGSSLRTYSPGEMAARCGLGGMGLR